MNSQSIVRLNASYQAVITDTHSPLHDLQGSQVRELIVDINVVVGEDILEDQLAQVLLHKLASFHLTDFFPAEEL